MTTLALLFLSFSITCISTAYNPNGIKTLENQNKINALLSINAITTSDNIGKQDIYKELAIASSQLKEQMTSFTDQELINVINNNEYTIETKIIAIQLSKNINHGQGINDSTNFKEIINQPSVNQAIRMNLLNAVEMDSETDIKLLENIIKTDEGDIVVQAMKKISQINFDKAVSISDGIIENYQNYNNDAIRSAVKTKSKYFKNMGNNVSKATLKVEKQQYIDFCFNMFKNIADEVFQDTMIFSLSEMFDMDAIKSIVLNDMIDRDVKIFCIDQNYQTLVKIITDNPSKADMDVLIKAMDLFPIKEMAPLMKDKVDSTSSTQQQQLISVISKIESQGRPATQKWLKY